MRSIAVCLFMVSFGITGLAWGQITEVHDACDDSVYLSLKTRDINTLTEREYEYFMQMNEKCIDDNATGPSGQAGPTQPCDVSRSEGKKFAEEEKFATGAGWFALGAGAGFLGGMIGGTVVSVIAGVSNPEPDDVDAMYDKDCYKKGYKRVVKRKRIIGSVTGVFAGLGGLLALLLAVGM